MSGEIGELIDELKLVHTILVFVGFAVVFSLAKSYLGLPVMIFHAVIPAGIFFIANAAKYIYDEYL